MIDTVINLVLWVLGLIVGGVIGYYLNRHFYKKSKKKIELTTRLHHSTSTFLINKDIEEHLEIRFKGKEVSFLHQFQFVILNSGNIPIKTPLKPLSLIIPEYYDYISIEINHIHPVGREINFHLSDDNHRINFLFDLLNPKDYFVLNLMLSVGKENKERASLERPEFHFTITSEDLPPILKTDLVTFSNYIESSILDLIKPFGKLLLPVLYYFMGFISIGGIFMLGLLIKISIDNDYYNIINYKSFFINFNLWSLFILVSWILLIPLLLFTVFSILEFFRKKKQLKKGFVDELDELPKKILKQW